MGIDRRGQALVELAVGMVIVSLVLSALFGFTDYILASMNAQRSLRAEAGKEALGGSGGEESYVRKSRQVTLTVSPMAADTIFGRRQVEIREEIFLPMMGLGEL